MFCKIAGAKVQNIYELHITFIIYFLSLQQILTILWRNRRHW